MDDFDFGFSLVDEDELEAVQKATVKVEAATTTSAAAQAKIDQLYNILLPVLPGNIFPDTIGRKLLVVVLSNHFIL